ncbi:MAG: hypothetical protein L3J20_13840, partial [Flavobacteriaceae bacterium]|nr:hypothetical protein [Flavobacteriaceae bacterium]
NIKMEHKPLETKKIPLEIQKNGQEAIQEYQRVIKKIDSQSKIFYRMGHDYDENQDWCWLVAKKDEFKYIFIDVRNGKSVVDTLNGNIEMHMEKKHGSSLLCDYIGTWHDVHIVSEKFKKILENEKLVSFEFLPIQIFDKKGIEVTTSAFYVANIQTFQDCLITDEDEDGKDTIIDTTKLIPGTRIFAAPKPREWYIRRDFAIEIKKEQGCVGIGFYTRHGGLINNGKIITR